MATAEIYNPTTSSWSTIALNSPRANHTAVLLPHNNSVMLIGGNASGQDLNSTEMIRTWANDSVPAGTMSSARAGAAVSGLAVEGIVLAAGGSNQMSAEVSRFATIKTDRDDYLPGNIVVITGTGYKPDEQVFLHMHQDRSGDVLDYWTDFATTADAEGKIWDATYAPKPQDLGSHYHLTAVGQTSALQAQTTFTDGSVKMTIYPNTGTTTITMTSHMTVTGYNDVNTGDAQNACTTSYTAGLTTVLPLDNSSLPSNIGLGNNTYAKLVADPFASDGTAFKSWQNTSGAFFNPGGLGANVACVENVKSGNQTWIINYGGPTKLVFTNPPVNELTNTCATLTLQTQTPDGAPSNPTADFVIDLTSSSGTPTWYANADCSGSATTSATIPATGNTVTIGYKDGTAGTPTVTAAPTGSSFSRRSGRASFDCRRSRRAGRG